MFNRKSIALTSIGGVVSASIIIAGLLFLAAPLRAQDADQASPPSKDGSKFEPAEVDCHYVERIERRPAGPQCGWNDLSLPNPGKFRCGMVAVGNQCVDKCFFVECEGQ